MKMNRFNNQPIVYATRCFPPGCGTPIDSSTFLPRTFVKNQTSTDHAVAAAPKPKGPSLKQEPDFGHSLHHRVNVEAPKSEATSSLRQVPDRSVFAPPKREGTSSDLTAREKVLEVLGIYKQVFRQLSQDKEARRGGDLFHATARIDLRTLAVMEKMGKVVNIEKRIGSVPGIQVGDEFQYKTELRVVGLHFKTMCGIDYMKMGDVKFATSIVASEGYGYDDRFASDVVVYTGEGGNVISKEKETEDQKLLKGNLALANSMRHKTKVRVIRGEERLDRKGKRYVYDGLYLVEKYWVETVRGKSVYKFKLCKIPGQPSI